MNENPIAFFDSGVGGITVFKQLKQILPNENYMYYGDLKHIPYGEKSNAELLDYTTKVFKFFEEKEAKAVVMACNTTSAAVYDKVKDKFEFKIYPIIQSSAGVIAHLPVKKIGVFATEVTINSNAYQIELKKHNPNLEVVGIACPEFVKIVEEKRQKDEKSQKIIKFYMEQMLKTTPDIIVLGCTHYPYLLDEFSKFAPKDMFINPAKDFADFIKNDLEKNNLLNPSNKEGYEKFYVSANPEAFKDAAQTFYPIKEIPQLV